MDRIAYYFQTNLFCIVILFLLRHQLKQKTEQSSTARLYMNGMLWATFALCLSDMVAGSLRGMMFPGARAILEISNMLFFMAMTAIGYFWLLYARIRLNSLKRFDHGRAVLLAIPMLIFTCLAVTNPLTHLVFYLDDHNIYHRNSIGVVVHWVVSWSYLVVPAVMTLRVMLREKSRYRRRELMPVLSFIIAPALAALIQMVFYGLTVTQVGITVSILVIFLDIQNSQVLTDALTGLDNRRGFYNRISHLVQHRGRIGLSVVMMDLDRFKSINDTYGHIAGDNALVEVSGILGEATSNLRGRVSTSRYGGDEFSIAVTECTAIELQSLLDNIRNSLVHRNEGRDVAFPLTLSAGHATALCGSLEDVDRLIDQADKQMYQEKSKVHSRKRR